MTSTAAISSPESIIADFERRATRYETPCGDGTLVWRAWGAGPPVLLLHGAHGSWAHWIRNIDALARFRTVWAADLPGFGESASPPRVEDGASFAEALAAGLRELIGAELPIDVVGFSLGGVIGGHLAATAPDVVRRLILVGTGGLDTPHGHVATVRARGLEGDALIAARRTNMLAIMLHDPESVDDLALLLQRIDGPRARVKPAALVLPDKLLQVLPKIRAQIDAIWGEKDGPHPDPALQHAVLRRFQPGAEMRVIPRAGHWAMYEGAPVFNTALRELLDRPLRNRPV